MARIQQPQLPAPSIAWTVPPDLAPDEARWAWHAIVPGSERDLSGGGRACSIKCVGWVRGPALPRTPWQIQEEKQLKRIERLKRRWARQKGRDAT
jgi:hypothetical protein